MACRIIFNLKKFDHISIYLEKLHWLKVPERIEYKVAVLVFKCVHGTAPLYLQSLLTPRTAGGVYSLRSSACIQLYVPPCTNSQARNGAFQHLGPRIWNRLPSDLRLTTDLSIFQRKLKTHLFMKSYQNSPP